MIALEGAGGVEARRYDEYGNADGNYSGRFQYTGQTWLPELGLYYYKARVYMPPPRWRWARPWAI